MKTKGVKQKRKGGKTEKGAFFLSSMPRLYSVTFHFYGLTFSLLNKLEHSCQVCVPPQLLRGCSTFFFFSYLTLFFFYIYLLALFCNKRRKDSSRRR